MTISAERKYSRLMRLRRICGYGAAISVAPYLLIKIVWTFGIFLPTEQMGDASWRIINAVTAVLAAIGIFLAMAFCRPLGERLPAWLFGLVPVYSLPCCWLHRFWALQLWYGIKKQVPPTSGSTSRFSSWSHFSGSASSCRLHWRGMQWHVGQRHWVAQLTTRGCRAILYNCRSS